MRYNQVAKLILLMTVGLALGSQPQPASAQKPAAAGQYLTKGDAIMMLSATDFMKKKVGELLSWTVGYDVTRVNRVRLTPTINFIKARPRKLPPDGRTVFEILASVDDPGGLSNIAGVRADLSSIGRLPNTMLVDNGLYGDESAGDGIYTLQASVSPRIGAGAKDIPVAAANKKGWLALAKTNLEINKNPVIIEAVLEPDKAAADGKVLVTLSVKVDNPGRLEDISSVTANLSQLLLPAAMNLKNDGQEGDLAAGDGTWTLQFMLPEEVEAGNYSIPIEVTNLAGGQALGQAKIAVYK